MKKILFFLIPILLFAGCKRSDTTANPATPTPQASVTQCVFLQEPEIIIRTSQSYHDGGGWVDNEELRVKNGEDKVLRGDGFSILLKFDQSIDPNTILQYIKANGTSEIEWSNSPGIVENEHCFYGSFKKYEDGGQYTLFIDKNIADKSGNKMKDDVNIKFTLKDTTKAYYSYKADYCEYSHLGVSYNNETERAAGMPILSIPSGDVEFIMDFTGDTDRQSVEKSISEGLKSEKASFKWISDRKLQLDLINLPKGNHIISMTSAKDKDGDRIIGSMDITVGDATQILSLDTQNKAVEKIKQFSNMMLTYFVPPGPIDYFSGFVGDYFKIFDKVKTYYYKADDGKMIPAGPEADAVSNLGPDGSVIYVDIQQKSDGTTNKRVLTKYDPSTAKRTTLFELPDIEMNELTLSMSPDGKKAAFYLRSSDGLFVRVYDLKGKILFHKRDIKAYIPGYTELMWDYQKVQWINDDTFVYENKAADRNSYDIREVDLKTGKDRVIIKDAFQPVTLPGKNLIAAKIYEPEKEKDPSLIGIFENGTKISEFIEGENRVFDFVFSSDGKLYMNCWNFKIYCYDPSTKKLEQVSDGLIRGMSKDRKKLYFIKDFDAVMPEY